MIENKESEKDKLEILSDLELTKRIIESSTEKPYRENYWKELQRRTEKYVNFQYEKLRRYKNISSQDIEDEKSKFWLSLLENDYRIIREYIIQQDKYPCELSVYLTRLANWRVIDYLKAKNAKDKHLVVSLTYHTEDGEEYSLDEIVDVLAKQDNPDPIDNILTGQQMEKIQKSISKLSGIDKKIIRYRFYLGWKFSEIAEYLQIKYPSRKWSEGLVAYHLNKALEQIKKDIEQD